MREDGACVKGRLSPPAALCVCRIPDVGEEVEVLGTALEKGLLDLAWDDYIPDPRNPGEVIENPRN